MKPDHLLRNHGSSWIIEFQEELVEATDKKRRKERSKNEEFYAGCSARLSRSIVTGTLASFRATPCAQERRACSCSGRQRSRSPSSIPIEGSPRETWWTTLHYASTTFVTCNERLLPGRPDVVQHCTGACDGLYQRGDSRSRSPVRREQRCRGVAVVSLARVWPPRPAADRRRHVGPRLRSPGSFKSW